MHVINGIEKLLHNFGTNFFWKVTFVLTNVFFLNGIDVIKAELHFHYNDV
jgi:hypothetical protein